ncbi:hypothetical protein ALQ88_04592, partial [Pseudomonas savastanoi]
MQHHNSNNYRRTTTMKSLPLLVGLGALTAASSVFAWDYVLLDTDKTAQNQQITSQQLGVKTDKPFTVTMRTLHGGRQEGVSIIDIDN